MKENQIYTWLNCLNYQANIVEEIVQILAKLTFNEKYFINASKWQVNSDKQPQQF
jgi:hypothetical protein